MMTKNQHRFIKSNLFLSVVLASLLIVGGLYVWQASKDTAGDSKAGIQDIDTSAITNFEECAKAAGAIIIETYPEQCQIGNKTFVNKSAEVPGLNDTSE